MSVTRLTAARYAVPFRVPFVSGVRTWEWRELWLVRLAGADGVEGAGEVVLDPAAGPREERRAGELLDALVAELGGADDADGADDPDGADIDRLEDALARLDAEGAVGRAVRAGLETAWLDLRAQRAERPFWSTLAEAAHGSIAVNATIGALDPDRAARAAAEAVRAGFACLKLKVGGEATVGELVERVAAVRAAAGAETKLRLDVNGAWDADRAIAWLAALAPFGIEYVEQPVPADRPDELARVRRSAAVAVAADEAIDGLGGARAILAADAADVLVVKPGRVGGPRAARRIAEEAAAVGVLVVISSLFESGVGLAAALHLAATLPDPSWAHGLATADLLVSDLLLDGPTPAGGRLRVPDGPGLGVRLDPTALERWRAR